MGLGQCLVDRVTHLWRDPERGVRLGQRLAHVQLVVHDPSLAAGPGGSAVARMGGGPTAHHVVRDLGKEPRRGRAPPPCRARPPTGRLSRQPERSPAIDDSPAWARRDWVALAVVTLGAAAVRLPGLASPSGFVFDEIFYARNACRFVIDTAQCGIDELVSGAHPPLGNWLIGIGIRLFGYHEFGWRIAAATTRSSASSQRTAG